MDLTDTPKPALGPAINTAHIAADTDALTRIARSGYFRAGDVGWLSDTYFRAGTGPGTPWDALRHAHLELPDWFQHDLDPYSADYTAQQHRLWALMSGVQRPYRAAVDEKEAPWSDIDPVRAPGFFVRRDAGALEAASDHVLATGMLLRHCGLKAGDQALEYGAGFAQTALTLARLGVTVDTVDISATFCNFVRRQARFFRVPLTPFQGHFGVNPRPGQKYRLIWFYESFHHCLNFAEVVQQLREQLAEGGRVILGGEPIVEREYAAVPYPWGLRLHSEVAAVVRRHHWFELGFSEDFLVELFTNAGFVAQRIECPPSLFGQLYVFTARPAEIHLGHYWLPTVAQGQWHGPEPDGRWTAGDARLAVDAGEGFTAIELDLVNFHACKQEVALEYGDQCLTTGITGGEQKTLSIAAVPGVRALTLRCRALGPSTAEPARGSDPRSLGIFVRRLRYISPPHSVGPGGAGAR
jgi:SAM-dependent methyltransferase